MSPTQAPILDSRYCRRLRHTPWLPPPSPDWQQQTEGKSDFSFAAISTSFPNWTLKVTVAQFNLRRSALPPDVVLKICPTQQLWVQASVPVLLSSMEIQTNASEFYAQTASHGVSSRNQFSPQVSELHPILQQTFLYTVHSYFCKVLVFCTLSVFFLTYNNCINLWGII